MTYLLAKARTRSKYLHSAMIVPRPDGGVDLYMLTKQGDALVPFGSSWHESESAAKADASETMNIRDSDWVTHDSEPEWCSAVREAVDDAIQRYTDAVSDDPNIDS